MHRLKHVVKINRMFYCDLVFRTNAASGHSRVQHLEASFFSFFSRQCPITSRQRPSSAARSRDARFYPTCSLAA